MSPVRTVSLALAATFALMLAPPASANVSGSEGFEQSLAASIETVVATLPADTAQSQYETAIEGVLRREPATASEVLRALATVASNNSGSPTLLAAIAALSERWAAIGDPPEDIEIPRTTGLGGGVDVAGVHDIVFLIDAALAGLSSNPTRSEIQSAVVDTLGLYDLDGGQRVFDALVAVASRPGISRELMAALAELARERSPNGDTAALSALLDLDAQTDGGTTGGQGGTEEPPPPPVNTDLGGGSDYNAPG